jgi:hypothetical protein
MKIEKYINDNGEWRCFVVSNTHVSRSGFVRMIASCNGVFITKHPKFFDDDVFCEFEINGHKFCVEEPYGDNTTYDVVAPEANLKEMEFLAKHIENTSPIKGGDLGHQIYFLMGYVIRALVFFAIVRAIWVYFGA